MLAGIFHSRGMSHHVIIFYKFRLKGTMELIAVSWEVLFIRANPLASLLRSCFGY